MCRQDGDEHPTGRGQRLSHRQHLRQAGRRGQVGGREKVEAGIHGDVRRGGSLDDRVGRDQAHGIPEGAVVVGAVGGVTPEKRLPELLAAMATLGDRQPPLHLLVVGAPAAHYDVAADAAARGLEGRVHVTGFVDDTELGAYLAAIDICACLRWPSNGETSASWWRAMAAGRATIITDLVHQPELPVVDPRGWRTLGPAGAAPVAVAIPILDEHRTLVETLDVLGRSAVTRREIGDEARRYWTAHHTLDLMAEAYVALLPRAAARTAPAVDLPAHLRKNGDEHLTALLAPFGVDTPGGVSNG